MIEDALFEVMSRHSGMPPFSEYGVARERLQVALMLTNRLQALLDHRRLIRPGQATVSNTLEHR